MQIGQRDAVETLGHGLTSDIQRMNIHESLSALISSPESCTQNACTGQDAIQRAPDASSVARVRKVNRMVWIVTLHSSPIILQGREVLAERVKVSL